MQANQVIAQLQENLVKAYEELDLEQRSRKKSSESLVILSQQLVALQEKQTNLNSNEIGHLAVAGVPDDRSSMNADQGPSEIEATSSPTTPMPTEPTKKVPEEGAVDKKPEDTREKLLVHYNNRIRELQTKLLNAQGCQEQNQSFKQHLKYILENKAIVERMHSLRYISSKIAWNIDLYMH